MGGAAGQRAGLLRGGRGSGDAGGAAARRAGGAGRGGGRSCCATSAQRTVLLRGPGVRGCGDAVMRAGLLRCVRAAARRARLPADGAQRTGLRRGRRGFSAAGGAAARQAGLLRGRRGCTATAVLLAGLMQRTKLMLCGLGGGRCYCAAGKDAARQTDLAHRWPSSG